MSGGKAHNQQRLYLVCVDSFLILLADVLSDLRYGGLERQKRKKKINKKNNTSKRYHVQINWAREQRNRPRCRQKMKRLQTNAAPLCAVAKTLPEVLQVAQRLALPPVSHLFIYFSLA